MDILEKALEKSVQNESIENKKLESKVRPQSNIENKQQTFSLDWDTLAADGYLSREQVKSALIEEYRMIKRPLITNAFGKSAKGIKRANLILVTSSIPGEGKSFSAINLALSIANERDKNVLLIDADVSKPTLAKRLGVTESLGLIEYLESDDIDFSDICFKTDLPGLQVIPAGKRHAFSTELLSSNKMAEFVDELSQRYPDRIVIFDSPPLLAATQAEVLASLVGQVVFVISAETTMQSTVQDAIKKLESVDVVLALLNKSKHELKLDYYGYGQYGH